MTNELEIEKYKIDKKAEMHESLSKQKLEMSSMVRVGDQNLASIGLLADKFSKAGDLVPKEFQNSPERCFVAIYKGASLGLDAFTALQRIAVINGRATIWGDTALSLVRRSGLMIKFEEAVIDDGKNMIARCIVQRTNEAEHISEYSQTEAITANLWGNNVWKKYPKRMLKYRARAFALRDIFADVLDGLYLKEEIEGCEGFKDVAPSEPETDWQKLGKVAWGKDDLKNDFSDAPLTREKVVIKTNYYDEILDELMASETMEDFKQFEIATARRSNCLKKDNPEDYKKLFAMVNAHESDLKLQPTELNINLNQL